jgi:hypothetical protein
MPECWITDAQINLAMPGIKKIVLSHLVAPESAQFQDQDIERGDVSEGDQLCDVGAHGHVLAKNQDGQTLLAEWGVAIAKEDGKLIATASLVNGVVYKE